MEPTRRLETPLEAIRRLSRRVDELETRMMVYKVPPVIVERENETGLSAVPTASYAQIGSAVNVLLPDGWGSMDVSAECRVRFTQDPSSWSYYLTRITLNSQAAVPTSDVITNDRPAGGFQTTNPGPVMQPNIIADTTAFVEHQLTAGTTLTVTGLHWVIYKIRTS